MTEPGSANPAITQSRKGMGRHEPLLDFLVPLSLFGLLAERNEDPAGMVAILVIWLLLKFLLRTRVATAYWFLIGVLVVSLAELLHSATISSPSDLMLTLLAFAAGAGRSGDQWGKSLWILSSLSLVSLLFVEFDGTSGHPITLSLQQLRDLLQEQEIRIQRISVNRSGYIFGLVSLIGYGLFRHGGRGRGKWVAFAAFSLSYLLAFLTGSRAAMGLPLISVLIGEVAWWQREWVASRALPLSLLTLLCGGTFNIAIYADISPFAYRNPSDSGRADVAQCFMRKSVQSWPSFISGYGDDRISDFCRDATPPVPGEEQGPRHAHNTFLQILADHGLFAVLLMVVGIVVGFARNLKFLALPEQGLLAFVGITTCFFIFASALVESTLLKTSLQQVLTGYVLALGWRSKP